MDILTIPNQFSWSCLGHSDGYLSKNNYFLNDPSKYQIVVNQPYSFVNFFQEFITSVLHVHFICCHGDVLLDTGNFVRCGVGGLGGRWQVGGSIANHDGPERSKHLKVCLRKSLSL